MVGDQLPSTAAPAQRALTVAMTPAAPRAVLNSIAPTATAALSPALVRPLAPPDVAVIDEPDSVLSARDAESSIVAAAVAHSEMRVSMALQRETIKKPLPSRLDAAPAPRKPAATPARKSVEGESGSGARARPPPAVAGQPGANREARPASGNDPPEYPWTARVQGHQGRVVLSVWVSAEGEADRLAVLRSSGYPSLDRAAVAAVQAWRFRPARRGGYDTGSLLYVPVVFRLDDG
jgi:protein TonB